MNLSCKQRRRGERNQITVQRLHGAGEDAWNILLIIANKEGKGRCSTESLRQTSAIIYSSTYLFAFSFFIREKQ